MNIDMGKEFRFGKMGVSTKGTGGMTKCMATGGNFIRTEECLKANGKAGRGMG